ncbi:MAG: hypothetical protein MUC80_10050, partial [Candidatus Thermoplasmatota archaeon]|nr:hypothetical protein [Candidatus Thermoplasmatota archaeon]
KNIARKSLVLECRIILLDLFLHFIPPCLLIVLLFNNGTMLRPTGSYITICTCKVAMAFPCSPQGFNGDQMILLASWRDECDFLDAY